MSRFHLPLLLVTIVVALSSAPSLVTADVTGISAASTRFTALQPLTITVQAQDDDGVIRVSANFAGAALTVTNCTGAGPNQTPGKCDETGMAAVITNGSIQPFVNSADLDTDTTQEPITVTLTLVAPCSSPAAFTVSAEQLGNAGLESIALQCAPPSPTPTPTPAPTNTAVPPTVTPGPLSTASPAPSTPSVSVGVVPITGITPPSTGDGGLR